MDIALHVRKIVQNVYVFSIKTESVGIREDLQDVVHNANFVYVDDL